METLSNEQLVTMAVFLLGGEATLVDIEEIAIKAFELAPGRFCWKIHPDRIDLRIAQYALKDASTSGRGPLQGSIKRGYMLTAKGLAWAKSRDLSQTATSPRKDSIEQVLDEERIRLRRSDAYARYLRGEVDQIGLREFEDFTRVNDYFPQHIRGERYARLDHAVKGDVELEKLWSALKARFAH